MKIIPATSRNRNKHRLDWTSTATKGVHTARGFAGTADAAVFDHRPGELEQLGSTQRPCAPPTRPSYTPGANRMEPRAVGRQLPASDALLSAVSAVSFMQHSYADQPVHLVTPQASYGHAMLASGRACRRAVREVAVGKGQSLV